MLHLSFVETLLCRQCQASGTAPAAVTAAAAKRMEQRRLDLAATTPLLSFAEMGHPLVRQRHALSS